MNILLSAAMLAGALSGACPTEQTLPPKGAVNADTPTLYSISVRFDGDTGNYRIDDDEPKEEEKKKPSRPVRPAPRRTRETDAANENDMRFEEMKRRLDEKFEEMFKLKARLDAANSKLSEKWEEYYALRTAYNEQLQKLVAAWVTDNLY